MSTVQYKPEYTSMECVRESNDWGFHDEVYAIFVGIDWTKSRTAPRWFVRRTKVYGNVDAGESKGANNISDNVNLTKSGKYNDINPDEQIVLVQAMEHDKSSAWVIRRILYTVLERCLVDYKSGQQYCPLLAISGYNRAVMIENTRKIMSEVIKKARYVPGGIVSTSFLNNIKTAINIGNASSFSQFLNAVIAGIKVTVDIFLGIPTLVNPDDIVGTPQVLNITGDRRKYLTFSNSGKYTYKFTINKK